MEVWFGIDLQNRYRLILILYTSLLQLCMVPDPLRQVHLNLHLESVSSPALIRKTWFSIRGNGMANTN